MSALQWFDSASRVLFVHAHPDDETIATGGVLAALADAGHEPALVTLTRGERGEVRPGEFAHLQGTEELAAHREGELARALTALELERHAFLGTPPARAEGLPPRSYADSGMEWAEDGLAAPAPDAGPQSLSAAPVAELIADLIAAAAHWGAEAVVSYDALGGYRHPDHVRAHQLAAAVAAGLQIPFWEIVTDHTPGVDPGDVEHCDIGPWLGRKRAALRAHETQLSVEGDEIVHVGGQRQPIDAIERFHRLDP